MADAKKCDRCEKYYDTNRTEIRGYNGNICGVALARCNAGGVIRYLMEKDLCDDCISELMRFLDGAELEAPKDLYLD